MIQKKAMGRGLSAILNAESKQAQTATDIGAKQLIGNIVDLPISEIYANPTQPRTYFDQQALEGLAQSIKELGIIQPITVRKINDKYEIISGERRFRASQLAGLDKIPAFIRLANDQEFLEMALVENIQRQDLNSIEIALTFEKLIEDIKLTQDELSKRVGKERSTITNYLRLLKLDPKIQTAIRDGNITMGHGRALLSIEELENQLEIFNQVITQKLSVREAEKLISSFKNNHSKEKKANELSKNFQQGKSKLDDFFKTDVQIKTSSKGKGNITISFKNEQEFYTILETLNLNN